MGNQQPPANAWMSDRLGYEARKPRRDGKGRGMSRFKLGREQLPWLIVLTTLFGFGWTTLVDAQSTIVIGDVGEQGDAGWPWNFQLITPPDWVDWSKTHLLEVGDTVVFKYTNTTNLYQFSNFLTWQQCNTKDPGGVILTNKDDLCSPEQKLACGTKIVVTQKPQLFASTVGQQCQTGWKIIIQASSGAGIELPPLMWTDCYISRDNTPAINYHKHVNTTCLKYSTRKTVLVGYTHTVQDGVTDGESEWFYYPSQNYVHWAANSTHILMVDDTVVFRYTGRSQVVELPGFQAWLDCDYSHAKILSTTDNPDGISALYLKVRSNPRYIVGANDGSCVQGQKVIIQAMSGPGVLARVEKDSCHGWWECFLVNGTDEKAAMAPGWPGTYTSDQAACLAKAVLCLTLAGAPGGPTDDHGVFAMPGAPIYLPSPSPPPPPEHRLGKPASSNDLSNGAIAGIVIACILVVVIVIGSLIYFLPYDRPRYTPSGFKHRRKPSQEEVQALNKVGAVWGWDPIPSQA